EEYLCSCLLISGLGWGRSRDARRHATRVPRFPSAGVVLDLSLRCTLALRPRSARPLPEPAGRAAFLQTRARIATFPRPCIAVFAGLPWCPSCDDAGHPDRRNE